MSPIKLSSNFPVIVGQSREPALKLPKLIRKRVTEAGMPRKLPAKLMLQVIYCTKHITCYFLGVESSLLELLKKSSSVSCVSVRENKAILYHPLSVPYKSFVTPSNNVEKPIGDIDFLK